MTASPAQPKPEAGVRGEISLLLRQSSHYLLGLAGTMALGLVSFPIFTRVLPVADYGVIDLVQKILLVVTAIAKLGLSNSALRFYDAKEFASNPEAERRYYSTLFFGMLGPGLLVAAMYAAIVRLFAPGGGASGLVVSLMVSALLVVPRSAQTMFWSFLRVEERTKTYNVLVIVLKAATIAVILVLIHWSRPSAEIYFLATALVETALVIALTVPMLRRGTLGLSRFDTSYFAAMFSFGIPLVVNEISYVFLDAADRALVQRYLGDTELGMYAVAYGLASMIQGFLMTPLNLAVLPMYMRLWNAGERQKTIDFLSTGLDLLILGGAGLFVVVSASAHDLVLLSASSKYLGADALIPPIFGGLLIFTSYFFVNAGLMIGKKTARLAGVMAASAVVNIALNCALLPHMGLRGAALATLLSYAFCIGLMALVSFRELPLQIEWKRLAGYGVAAAAALAGSGLVHPKAVLVSALTKAALSAAIYFAVLFLIDPHVRRMASVLAVWIGQRNRDTGSNSTPGCAL